MQHRNFAQRLKAALESADSPSVTISSPNGGTEVIATGAVPYYAEDELMAAHDTADEIEAVVEEGDALRDAKVQLESLCATLESVKAPLTPYEVGCTALALEAIARRWGGEPIPMPAMEAFTNSATNRQAVISLEATAKEVIAQILKHLKELWEKFKVLIKKMVAHLVNFNAGMAKKVGVLKKNIEEGKFSSSKTKEKIDISAQIPAITLDGKLMTLPQLLSFEKLIPSLFRDVFGTLVDENSESSYRSLVNLLNTITNTNVEEVARTFRKRIDEASLSTKIFTLDSHYRTINYPGSEYFILSHYEVNGIRNIIGRSTSIEDFQHTIDPLTESEAKELSASCDKAIAEDIASSNAVSAFLDFVAEHRVAFEELAEKGATPAIMQRTAYMFSTLKSLVMNRAVIHERINGAIMAGYQAYLAVAHNRTSSKRL